jgi:excinuclease ABC subunit C
MTPSLQFDFRSYLPTVPLLPGVYQMFDSSGELLYVGKARQLRQRLRSYSQSLPPSSKTARLVAQIDRIEVIVTQTEAEALILENRLIKTHLPKYNILLRDDKSYPYLKMSRHHPFPVLSIYRGARRNEKEIYFGPYANTGAARFALHHLQTVFKLRQCSDTFFSHRSRPCLQYQIERCSGACVGHISQEEYAKQVEQVIRFLNGEGEGVVTHLIEQMEAAAQKREYEEAALFRDQISALRKVQAKQAVEGETGDLDVLGVATHAEHLCIQLFMIRSGQNQGGRPFYFPFDPNSTLSEVVTAFISQYYASVRPPKEIISSVGIEESHFIESALSGRWGHKVSIRTRCRAQRARFLQLAIDNAEHALFARTQKIQSQQARFESLQSALGWDELPARVEAFDVSHTQGDATVASAVVFEPIGAQNSAYRRYNISGVTASDDYAAMAQLLTRHYTRRLREEFDFSSLVVLIDGGKGQLSVAYTVLSGLLPVMPQILSIAEGRAQSNQSDQFYRVDEEGVVHSLHLDPPAANLLRAARDEAHRFAITAHRKKRSKRAFSSPLDGISGLGPKRRQNLLRSLGGLQGISSASVDELSRVPGISRKLAEAVYEKLHS